MSALRQSSPQPDDLEQSALERLRGFAHGLLAPDGRSVAAAGDNRSVAQSQTKSWLPVEQPAEIAHYEIIEQIGQGGIGIVYKALHRHLHRYVALKVLNPDRNRRSDFIDHFRSEMRTLGQLDHPNVIRATDAGEHAGQLYLVMELTEGINLASVLRRLGPLSSADACEIARQAAAGLDYIHRNGHVHRDIKPSNLFLCSNGVVKILDLGLAAFAQPISRPNRAGAVVGTLDYMPPEQAFGFAEVNATADVYSLGCTIYKLLTNEVPYGTASNLEQRIEIFRTASSREFADDRIPTELRPCIAHMVSQLPTDRFLSAREVVTALRPHSKHSNLKELYVRAAGPDSIVQAEQGTTTAGQGQNTDVSPIEDHKTKPITRRKLLVGGAIGVASAGLGLWTVQLTRNRNKKVRELVWPHHLEDSQWAIASDGQSIEIKAGDLSLLSLGELHEPQLNLAVRFRQAHPLGSIGLFLGYKHIDIPSAKDSSFYQTITVDSNGTPRSVFLRRTLLRVQESVSPLRHFAPGSIQCGEEVLATPRPLSVSIRVVVKEQRVSQIQVQGKEIAQLTAQQCDEWPLASECSGSFGLFVSQADVTVDHVYVNDSRLI